MEEVVYLDDFLEYLEQNGIDTSVIDIVKSDVDTDYVLEEDRSPNNIRIFENFLSREDVKTDNTSNWVVGFSLFIYTIYFYFFARVEQISTISRIHVYKRNSIHRYYSFVWYCSPHISCH